MLQDTLYWVDVQFPKGQDSLNLFGITERNHLQKTHPAYCILKYVVIIFEDIMYNRVDVSLRPPPKISYKNTSMNDWILTLLKKQRHPTNRYKTQYQIIKFGETRCVRWVAWLYQKPSLVLPHWTGQVDWTF